MGKMITLTGKDGFKFGAYQADPVGMPRGAIVVLQEAWGVNHHMRSMADRYAALGYLAIAPQLFDRAERNFEVGYTPEDLDRGRAMRKRVPVDNLLIDTQATIDYAKQFGKVATIGFSMGGGIAFFSATQLSGVTCAVSYYGGQILSHRTEKPLIPVLMHYGDADSGIPLSDVDLVRQAQPDVPLFVYKGDHNFNCDERSSFNAESAMIAGWRTHEFLLRHIG